VIKPLSRLELSTVEIQNVNIVIISDIWW